jgi:capsular exopolysaccharide synthesis family protein
VPKRWFRQPRPADHVVERPGSAFAEALCSLYASVARLAPSGRPMRLMVTSAVPGEGKTSTAAALARLLQRSGQRVVLVEGDLRRPQLARMLGTGQGPGLVELLRGSAEPSEVVYEDPVTSLALIPAGRPANDAYFLLGSSNMARVVDALARDFDIVIIDCAPVLPVADTRALVDHVDAAIFLCRWGVTPSAVVARGIETLRGAAAVPVVGVLAQVDLKRFSRYERGYDYAAAAQYYRD